MSTDKQDASEMALLELYKLWLGGFLVRELAQRAGMSKSGLYRLFKRIQSGAIVPEDEELRKLRIQKRALEIFDEESRILAKMQIEKQRLRKEIDEHRRKRLQAPPSGPSETV